MKSFNFFIIKVCLHDHLATTKQMYSIDGKTLDIVIPSCTIIKNSRQYFDYIGYISFSWFQPIEVNSVTVF